MQINPNLVVGNLIVGGRYVEPQGPCKIINETTGDICEIDFKYRGLWSTNEEDL